MNFFEVTIVSTVGYNNAQGILFEVSGEKGIEIDKGTERVIGESGS